MLANIDEAFLPCSKYVAYENQITALGENYSLTLSFTDGIVEATARADEWSLANGWIFFEEDSAESELVKYVYTLFRMWQKLPPYASAHMHKVLLGKLNKKLMYYDINILDSAERFGVRYCGSRVSLEDALGVMIQRNAGERERFVIRTDFEEAERLRSLGHHEEALPFYLAALEKENKESNIYTLASYGLGEVYYFQNDMEKTIRAYLCCDVNLLSDETELYRRLGHAFLDDKLQKYTDHLKAYFKSIQSVPYANRHQEETAEALKNVEEIFEEYEGTCIEVGKKQYETFRRK